MIQYIPLIDKLLEIISPFIPDNKKKEELRAALLNRQQDLTETLAQWGQSVDSDQAKINLADANKTSWHGGWRPLLAYFCVGAWVYDLILRGWINWIIENYYKTMTLLPEIPSDGVNTMLLYLLGFGAYRTFEKVKGVAKR